MRGRPRNPFPEVTDRQREVARLIAMGHTNDQIARELGISLDGAKYHVSELLGRLGLERREEIAAWYRAEQGSPVARTWRRLRAAAPMPLAVLGGAAGIVAVLVLFFVAFEGARGGGGADERGANESAPPSEPIVLERTPAEPVNAVDLTEERSGERWSSRAVADLGERDLLFLAYWPSGEPSLLVLDRGSGEWVGEIDGAQFPLMARSETRSALIVSARYLDPDSVDPLAPYVLSFDIADALEVGATLPLVQETRNLGGFSTPEEGMLTLSADERYLYHVGYDIGGGGTAEIEILDLDNEAQPVGVVEIPEHCISGGLPLYPYGSSSVIVTCRAAADQPGVLGTIQLLAPDGTLGKPIEADGLAGEMEGFSIPIAAAVEAPDGIGVIYFDGTYAVANDAGISVVGRALPEGIWVRPEWASHVLHLDSERIVIPDWKDREVPPDGAFPSGGFVIFNMGTHTIEHEFVIDHYGTYPLNEHELAIVGDGRLDILDLRTMSIVQAFDTERPGSPDAIPSVR